MKLEAKRRQLYYELRGLLLPSVITRITQSQYSKIVAPKGSNNVCNKEMKDLMNRIKSTY
jgi:hypothetical protein